MARKTAAQRKRAERAKRGWETRRKAAEALKAQRIGDAIKHSMAPQETASFSQQATVRPQQPADKVLTYDERFHLPLVETLRKQGDVNDAARTLHAELQTERRRGEIMGSQKATLDASQQHQNRLLCDLQGILALKAQIKGSDHHPIILGAETARALSLFLERHGFTHAGMQHYGEEKTGNRGMSAGERITAGHHRM